VVVDIIEPWTLLDDQGLLLTVLPLLWWYWTVIILDPRGLLTDWHCWLDPVLWYYPRTIVWHYWTVLGPWQLTHYGHCSLVIVSIYCRTTVPVVIGRDYGIVLLLTLLLRLVDSIDKTLFFPVVVIIIDGIYYCVIDIIGVLTQYCGYCAVIGLTLLDPDIIGQWLIDLIVGLVWLTYYCW